LTKIWITINRIDNPVETLFNKPSATIELNRKKGLKNSLTPYIHDILLKGVTGGKKNKVINKRTVRVI
jgi:hypothetical protein